MKRIALAAIVHTALLVAPIVAVGRGEAIARPGAVACIALLVALATAETAAKKGVSDPSRFGAPGTRLALVSAVGLLVTAWVAIAAPASASTAWVFASAFAGVVGIVLRVLAILTLGDAFTSETVLAPGRPVVRHGIYGYLRHPSDVGLLLFTAGIVGLCGSVAALVPTLLLVVPSTIARMRDEDRLLSRAPAVLSRS